MLRGKTKGRAVKQALTPSRSRALVTRGLPGDPWPGSPLVPLAASVGSHSPAVEVCGLLSVELTVGCAAVLCGPEALEPIVDELGVLLVEVLVGHHI